MWTTPPCYPETIPLRKAISKNIARELVLLFSRVSLLKDLLTDQGMQFVSKLMVDMYRLLQMKQLCTSMYHLQMDRIVKQFNQTLMLQKVEKEDGKNWDLLLLYVHFTIREIPQASSGFTTFKLLFGR